MNGASPAANNNNNNNNGSSNSSSGSNCNGNNSCSNTTSEAGSLPNSPDLQDDGTRLQQQQSSAQQPQQQQQQQQPRDNKIIAKPLPSRPMPFLQHGLNHPHLHSLLAHCRNPYLPGKIYLPFKREREKELVFISLTALSSNSAGGPQVFPLPPGQGFPWAHSTRGKPRRGMMRRAVFSGMICLTELIFEKKNMF